MAELGQEVFVENRPGAAGTVGIGQVAKAAADGYTLAVIELPHAIAPAVLAKVPYELERDFVPISLIGTSALVLFTNAIDARQRDGAGRRETRAKPGTVVLAHSGNCSLSHLPSDCCSSAPARSSTWCPYRGSGPALTDVAGGLVAGQRLPVLPQVPTLAEQGVKDMVLEQWWGLVAPVGTPPKVIDRIRRELHGLHAALGHTSVRERSSVLAIERQPTSGEDFTRFIRGESARLQKVARDAGLKPE